MISGSTIKIPSILINWNDGEKLKQSIQGDKPVIVELVWDIPVNNIVTMDLWMTATSREAYEFLNSDHTFDCIILDMYLPDAYGKDVLQKIREIDHRKTTPVIIYSGKTISKTEQKELYQEAMAVVQKNVNSYKVLLGHLCDIMRE